MLELDDPSGGGRPGWEYTPCASPTKCLFAVAAPVDSLDSPPVDAIGASVTLLIDQAPPPSTASDAGAPNGDPRRRVITGGPPGLIVQGVTLDPGAYVLSWWDQARSPGGSAQGGLDQEPYVAYVFDATWNAVAPGWDDVAFQPTMMPDWSSRRSIAFSVSASGTYYVAFGASSVTGPSGAMAISGVQLEKTANSGSPTAYIETGATLNAYTTICPAPSVSDLQHAFTRRCDGPNNACYYELNHPITIDSVALQTGASPLAGKIAQGNFNYRHVNVALNFVGTGVRTCPDGSGPSCFGDGYTEFSLYHDAEDVPILDWNGTAHYFDFETGQIEHGKALTAERYITLPIGSADQSLISQPGIQRIEFQGRPLDGRYRLRIWDNPALQWSAVQDVQIVLQYRYWSRVEQTAPLSP
jgi:hypothetical protein